MCETMYVKEHSRKQTTDDCDYFHHLPFCGNTGITRKPVELQISFVSSCRGKANNFYNSGEISEVGILPWLDFSSPNPCTPHTHAPACREDMSSPLLAPCPCPPSLPATPAMPHLLPSLTLDSLSFPPPLTQIALESC